jgi:hypothetical protein
MTMPKAKTKSQYITELKKMVKARTGKPCELWLLPQIDLTANNMVMIDKISEELDGKDLVSMVAGSMGQVKAEVNPLVPYYDKLQRTLLMQLEALGLNYNITPAKVTENTKSGGKDQDKLMATLDVAIGKE